MNSRRDYIDYLILLIIGIFWGSQFFFIKVAVQDIPPMLLATMRFFVGAASAEVVCRLLLHSKPTMARKPAAWNGWFWIGICFIIAIFDSTLPFLLMPYGELYVTSSTASILAATTPGFTFVLAAFFTKNEKLTPIRSISIIVGFCGIVVVMGPGAWSHLGVDFWGDMALVGTSVAISISIIMIRRLPTDVPSLFLARNILWISAFQTLILAFIFEKPTQVHFTWTAVLAVVYMGIVVSCGLTIAWVVLVKRAGATFASMSSYISPLVGVLVGVAFAGNILTSNVLVALIMILAAAAMLDLPMPRRRSVKP